ncbi:MAG: hypothetical protein IPM50_01775 [Acidobacteriota bacterium]|nr:MAG: hypothetical protein IPM50_01775 [Acidobacteriota bacterium]
MASEAGHARNLQYFQQLISFVTGYGATYDPSVLAIQLTTLQTLYAQANTALHNVTDKLMEWKVAVNARENEFAGIRQLVSRVVNAFAVSGAAPNAIEDAKSFKRKIDGKRAKAKPADDPNTDGDESAGNSVSQRSYTQLVEHLEGLIELLKDDGNYAPNEAELSIAGLEAKVDALKNANNAVINTFTPISNARIARNAKFYNDPDSLVETARKVKLYVRSLYGPTSPQYKQLVPLKFTSYKK